MTREERQVMIDQHLTEDELKEHRERFGREIIVCPVCGKYTLDYFHFCANCGYDNDPYDTPEEVGLYRKWWFFHRGRSFAVADIHGCYDKYRHLLETIGFSDNDILYVLGDVIDRGPDGIRILEDMIARPNIFCLRGNHEQNALIFLREYGFDEPGEMADRLKGQFRAWLSPANGGRETYEAFRKLDETTKRLILEYLNAMPVYRRLEVGGQRFFLAHTVPEKEKMEHPETCSFQTFLFGKPEFDKQYYEKTVIVTGHTPTSLIDSESTGRIWKGNNHVAIDCGAVYGNRLGCVCLDTMEEYYAE